MWRRQLRRWTGVVLLVAIARQMPGTVEMIYSTGIYRLVRSIDLFFLRWVPFSVGDLLYIVVPVWWLGKAYAIYRKEKRWNAVALFVSDGLRKLVLWFYLLWGLNYFRYPLYRQMHLEWRPVTAERLAVLARREADSLNALHRLLQPVDSLGVEMPYDLAELNRIAAGTYRANTQEWPLFSERYYVVKASLWPDGMSYMGVLGYLNPFTHESQVNPRYPAVFLPHTVLHELAHQIGYAPEDEAEFIGYLEGIRSRDPYFRYSARLVALRYLLIALHRVDPGVFREVKSRLLPGILAEYRKAADFARAHRSPVDTAPLYDYYLKFHQGGKGLESYPMMIRYLAAYSQ